VLDPTPMRPVVNVNFFKLIESSEIVQNIWTRVQRNCSEYLDSIIKLVGPGKFAKMDFGGFYVCFVGVFGVIKRAKVDSFST